MDSSSTTMIEFPHQPLLFYPYYSYHNNNNDDLHQVGSYGYSSSLVSMDDVSDDVSSSFPASAAMALADGDHQPMNLMVVDDVSDWLVSESSLLEQQNCLEDEAASQHPSPISSGASKNLQSSLYIPAAGLDKEESADAIFHLLKAYGEAVEMDALELAAEIARKLRDKSSPTGSTVERLACYLIQPPDQQFESLVEEAVFNSAAAFKAFYQIFPYGRFAHFCANSVILNAVRDDAELVHIVDFDIGTGVQWPPVIEALARRGLRALKLTAIKWEGETSINHNLEQTRENLLEYARASGLRLQIGEMEMEEALRSCETAWKAADKREWLAFNCMVGLPHMGKVRTDARSVVDFLKLAKESTRGGRASITFGDGIGWGRRRGMGAGAGGYGAVFEGMLVQFQALLETMDCHFQREQMREARIAMEWLLLMPYFVSATDMRMWDDIGKESKALSELGLEACEMQEASIMEAKELVREGEGYWATNEGAMRNQMVLGYMGTPLVKVSSWR